MQNPTDRAPVRVIEDERFQEHRGPQGHPERPARLEAVHGALARFEDSIERDPPRRATDEEVQQIHDPEHVARLRLAASQAPTQLDADTYMSEQSERVARLAAGSTIDLALSSASSGGGTGLAAVRPPGHHAEPDRAMGFCLFNNVAIAARSLQAELGMDRVLILDWDVHHGNGTQHAFESDPSVLYFSTHQYPYYPGTGDVSESGRGRGAGSTLNVPMPAGCGDDEFVGAMQRLLVPAAQSYRPDMILVSCGFDAHADDPLASMQLSRTGYADMTRIVRRLADELCSGRLCFVLEGGYSLLGLDEGTDAVLSELTSPDETLPETVPLEPGSTLRSIVDRVVSVHAGHHPGLGAA